MLAGDVPSPSPVGLEYKDRIIEGLKKLPDPAPAQDHGPAAATTARGDGTGAGVEDAGSQGPAGPLLPATVTGGAGGETASDFLPPRNLLTIVAAACTGTASISYQRNL